MSQESKTPSVAVKAGIVLALAIAVGIVLYAKNASSPSVPTQTTPPATAAKALPKLVDLGSKACIPCKTMAPILDELRKTFEGRFDVVFIDAREDPAAAERYGVRAIPTQIFYDAAGQERFRHQGFFSREEILAKWKELGVDVEAASPAETL